VALYFDGLNDIANFPTTDKDHIFYTIESITSFC